MEILYIIVKTIPAVNQDMPIPCISWNLNRQLGGKKIGYKDLNYLSKTFTILSLSDTYLFILYHNL